MVWTRPQRASYLSLADRDDPVIDEPEKAGRGKKNKAKSETINCAESDSAGCRLNVY